jgi:hypothetical protein
MYATVEANEGRVRARRRPYTLLPCSHVAMPLLPFDALLTVVCVRKPRERDNMRVHDCHGPLFFPAFAMSASELLTTTRVEQGASRCETLRTGGLNVPFPTSLTLDKGFSQAPERGGCRSSVKNLPTGPHALTLAGYWYPFPACCP